MGRVRTKTVKRAAKVLLERHYQKLTNDFHINKKILSEVAKVPTKSLRNKIAGYATHLVKRIQKGPVKGISLKVQEEEREKRLDWVPKESEINTDKVQLPLFRSPSTLIPTKCLKRDLAMISLTNSEESSMSRPTKLSRKTPGRVADSAEDLVETETEEEIANPERTSNRRRKRRLRKLPSKKRRLRTSLLSVKAEEEEIVRVNSDLLF